MIQPLFYLLYSCNHSSRSIYIIINTHYILSCCNYNTALFQYVLSGSNYDSSVGNYFIRLTNFTSYVQYMLHHVRKLMCIVNHI
jgi:hypothetical protein